MKKKLTYQIFRIAALSMICFSVSYGISIDGFRRNQDIIRCDYDGSTFNSIAGPYTNYEWFIGSTQSGNKIASGPSVSSSVIDGRLFVSLILTADSAGYTVQSTHTIFSQAPPAKPNLGIDKTICDGDSLLIQNSTTYPTNFNFSWNNSTSTSQSRYVNNAGVYILTVSNAIRCRRSDTIVVDLIPNNVDLDPVTAMCEGSTVTLTNKRPIENTSTVYWSNGISTKNNEVSIPGKYKLTITATKNNATCYYTDSTNVLRKPNPEIILGSDTAICYNQTLTLKNYSNKSVNFTSSYTWNSNTSNNGTTFDVNQTGVYTLKLVSPDNCEAFESVNVRFFNPTFSLPNDTSLCEGSVIQPLAGREFLPTTTITWNGSTTNKDFKINTNGKHIVEISDAEVASCVHKDSITVDYLTTPKPSLEPEIESEEAITVDGSINLIDGDNVNYAWVKFNSTDTISTDSLVNLTETIKVVLHVQSNDNLCVGKSTLLFTLTSEPIVPDPIGPGLIFVPTAFSGGAIDEQNRVFKVMGTELSDDNFEVRIYDRWGNVVFSSTNFEQMNTFGWDGSLSDGTQLTGGAYAFVVNATHKSGQEIQKSGTVTYLP